MDNGDYLFAPAINWQDYGAAATSDASATGMNVGFTAFMPAFNADVDLANLGSVEWDQVRLAISVLMQLPDDLRTDDE